MYILEVGIVMLKTEHHALDKAELNIVIYSMCRADLLPDTNTRQHASLDE